MDSKHCAVQIFNDNTRKFVLGTIDVSTITAIADKVSVHYGFDSASECIRLQLGPGKWAYIAADDAPMVRAAWAMCPPPPPVDPIL